MENKACEMKPGHLNPNSLNATLSMRKKGIIQNIQNVKQWKSNDIEEKIDVLIIHTSCS